MAYLSACLKREGFDVVCFDDQPDALRDQDYDVLLTGGMSVHYRGIKALVDASRRYHPDAKVVLGGAFVTSDPALAQQLVPHDYGVKGEGEVTVVELARAIQLGKQPNEIAGLVGSPDREAGYLDTFPIPDYSGWRLERYLDMQHPLMTRNMSVRDNPRMASIITSRSCPFHCTFCYHPLGQTYRERSLDSVFEEIFVLVNGYGVNMLHLFDELFSRSRERVMEFCRRITPFDLKWTVLLRVDQVDAELLNTLRSAGCFNVGYGVESASNKVLRSMKKGTTIALVDKAMSLAREAHMGVQANLIFGDAAEDEATAAESFAWLVENRAYQLWLCMIRVVPDSALWRLALERGVIRDKAKHITDGLPLVNVSQLSARAYRRLTNRVLWFAYGDPEEYRYRPTVTSYWEDGDNWGATIICPWCGGRSTYRNLRPELSRFDGVAYSQLYCRRCYQRLNVLNSELFPYLFRRALRLRLADYVLRHRWTFAVLMRLRRFDGVMEWMLQRCAR